MAKQIDLRNICAKCGGNHNTSVHPIPVSKPRPSGGNAPRCVICGYTKGHDALKHKSRRRPRRRMKCPKCGSFQHRIHPVKRNGAQQFISGTVSQFSNGESVQ